MRAACAQQVQGTNTLWGSARSKQRPIRFRLCKPGALSNGHSFWWAVYCGGSRRAVLSGAEGWWRPAVTAWAGNLPVQ
jgi:hypothetical protein